MRKRTLILLLAGILLCGFVITPLLDASDTKYYGSKKSNKYHKATCRYVEKIKDENLVTFNSVKEARDAGYVPCKVCKPPKKDNQENLQTNYPSSETLYNNKWVKSLRRVARIILVENGDIKLFFRLAEPRSSTGSLPAVAY